MKIFFNKIVLILIKIYLLFLFAKTFNLLLHSDSKYEIIINLSKIYFRIQLLNYLTKKTNHNIFLILNQVDQNTNIMLNSLTPQIFTQFQQQQNQTRRNVNLNSTIFLQLNSTSRFDLKESINIISFLKLIAQSFNELKFEN